MKMAVLMDPIHHLKPYKDSSVGMLKSAAQRGLDCYCFTPSDLHCRDGQAYAEMTRILVGDVYQTEWAKTWAEGEMPLSAFDLILMRKDPPFNLEYIYCTYMLELAEKSGVLVANRPQSLRDVNEKFFTLNFPQCCPLTLVSHNIRSLRGFWEAHKNVVFKPLDGMGGNAIFHIGEDGRNLSVVLEVMTEQQTKTIMAQRYIPDIIEKGDKRVLLINGEPFPKALARIPKAGELRGNLAAGASSVVVDITERDRWICSQISPVLKERGLYFVGIDIIGDYLTEINVTSPTCAIEIEAGSGLDITGQYLDYLISLC